MNDQERNIWAAAYGAAFVARYEETLEFAQDISAHQRQGELPSDMAARTTNAEWPGYIADLAVRRYREWRQQENPRLGTSVDGESDRG